MIGLIDPTTFGQSLGWFALAALLTGYLFIRALIFQGGTLLFVQKSLFAQRRKVYRLPFANGQLKSELLAGLQAIIIDGLVFATMVKFGPSLPWNQNLLLTFAISFVWFEIWFYVSHRLFHTKALYFIHEQHHTARVTSPMTALSFSILERTLLVAGGFGVLALISLAVPISALGIAIYLLVNYALNIFGHSNVEVVPPSFLKNPIGSILNSPTYHALHHARYQGQFGLFTPYLDRLFGSRFADYERVHDRAYHEQGLTHLGERLGTGG